MNLLTAQSLPASTGKRHLVAHLQGNPTTRAGAMAAKCCECMGGFTDGRVDCRIVECPIYPWMPYRNDPTPSRRRKPSKKPIAAQETAESGKDLKNE